MSEFRDAIGYRIAGADDGTFLSIEDAAEAVLTMPEMQAIRAALHREAKQWVGVSYVEVRQGLVDMGLPESVIEWVLEDNDE